MSKRLKRIFLVTEALKVMWTLKNYYDISVLFSNIHISYFKPKSSPTQFLLSSELRCLLPPFIENQLIFACTILKHVSSPS